MKQVALPAGFDSALPFELRGGDFHHLARVRRIRAGDRLRGRTPDGRAFDLVVRAVGRDSLTLAAVAALDESAADPWEITLLQCVPRGPKLDQIVRQAVEAGVSRIVLVQSERSLAREGDWTQRLRRLERIAREAMEQSGARPPAAIALPVPLESLTAAPGAVSLFLHEKPLATLEGAEGFVYSPRSIEDAAPPSPAAPGLHDHLAGGPARVDLLVGPEGGLAAREVTRLLGAGFRPVHLGGTVLRVETAAVFALGAVKTLLLERERWTVRRQQ